MQLNKVNVYFKKVKLFIEEVEDLKIAEIFAK